MIFSEKTYFSEIKNSDKSAFEAFFKLYYEQLCRFAYSILKEQEASEEIVQDVFFKIWEKRENINIQSSEKSYLFSAVRNSCFNEIKHLEIKENYKQFNQEQIQEHENVSIDFASDSQLRDHISRSISQLPEQRRIIFQLSREEGLKYREIAERLKISVKTVEAQMGKALKFLREELADFLILLIISIFSQL